MSVAAIEVSNARKSFGSLHALNGVDLRVEQGEFFALLGPNGAGKTTLISALAGLLRLNEGSLKVMGFDVVKDYRQARTNLGVVPQELVFDPFFTVRETLRFQSGYFGLRNNDDWIEEILASLDLLDKANTNMRTLSGGMKRRVLVAQALVHRPPVIILDEPTAGVDVELRQGLWQFMKKLNEKDHTIILTTHYLEEAENLCRRIAMMKAGQIVALDTTANLLHSRATHSLRVRVEGALPAGSTFVVDDSGWLVMNFEHVRDVEAALGRLRQAGIQYSDLHIEEADLEQVFVSVMKAN